jgi:glycine hydroxymethyltransferase
VPFDQRKPFDPSGLRIGTASVTTRGMTEGDMDLIAGWIDRAVAAAKDGKDNELDVIAGEIREHTKAFPIPGWKA